MIKFKETYKNLYSDLLEKEENNNKEYKIKLEFNERTIVFYSKYRPTGNEREFKKNNKKEIELKELEWEF